MGQLSLGQEIESLRWNNNMPWDGEEDEEEGIERGIWRQVPKDFTL